MSNSPSEDEQVELFWRSKILHVLSVYPKISPSMLQVALGTSVPSHIWRGILNNMTKEGLITQTEVIASFSGGQRSRTQAYKVIQIHIEAKDPHSIPDAGLAISV